MERDGMCVRNVCKVCELRFYFDMMQRHWKWIFRALKRMKIHLGIIAIF